MKKLFLIMLLAIGASVHAKDYFIYDMDGHFQGWLKDDFREGHDDDYIIVSKYGFLVGYLRDIPE